METNQIILFWFLHPFQSEHHPRLWTWFSWSSPPGEFEHDPRPRAGMQAVLGQVQGEEGWRVGGGDHGMGFRNSLLWWPKAWLHADRNGHAMPEASTKYPWEKNSLSMVALSMSRWWLQRWMKSTRPMVRSCRSCWRGRTMIRGLCGKKSLWMSGNRTRRMLSTTPLRNTISLSTMLTMGSKANWRSWSLRRNDLWGMTMATWWILVMSLPRKLKICSGGSFASADPGLWPRDGDIP